MKITVVFGIILVLAIPGVFPDGIPDERVKEAYMSALSYMRVSPEIIDRIEKGWDGNLPEDIGEILEVYKKSGYSPEQIKEAEEILKTVVRNKDNPSWKTHYGNLFVRLGGADKSRVEELKKLAPDHLPADVNEAKEALKRTGVTEEHAQGYAKILAWLGGIHV